MRVALVHDWLVSFGGAEQVLLALKKLFPDAPIYTLIFDKEKLPEFSSFDIRTSFIQNLPFAKKKFRFYLPLMPMAIEQFDFSEYDLVISSSHAFAKGIITRPGTTHICYCHTPMRYAWTLYQQYLTNPQIGGVFTKYLMPLIMHPLRVWDVSSADRVDYFVANSENVKKRIQKYYRRDAEVIYPPVQVKRVTESGETGTGSGETGTGSGERRTGSGETATGSGERRTGSGGRRAENGEPQHKHPKIKSNESFTSNQPLVTSNYFMVVSRLIPQKNIGLVVDAFNELGVTLVIIGEGSEREKLQARAKSNIQFLGFQPEEVVNQYLANCKAFIFPAEDDFGMAPVEAMAFGKPVIALGKGGSLETVIPGKTGILFENHVESLQSKVENIDSNDFNAEGIQEFAMQFGESVFLTSIKKFIEQLPQ